MPYQVVSGDNWQKISGASGISEETLHELNPDVGNNGESLVPGSLLVMPGDDDPKDATPAALGPPVPTVSTVSSAVPAAPPDPVSLEILQDLYNQGSELADRLHTFLSALALVIGASK